jgi:hypothetical protein
MSISAAFFLLTSAQAAPAAAPPTPPAQDADPVICQRIEETGSRLGSRKVCMRKSQWAEQRNEDRMLIDRSQIVGCKQGTGC